MKYLSRFLDREISTDTQGHPPTKPTKPTGVPGREEPDRLNSDVYGPRQPYETDETKAVESTAPADHPAIEWVHYQEIGDQLADPARPDPYARLRGPYRTARGTWAWSDPSAPSLEAFDGAVVLSPTSFFEP